MRLATGAIPDLAGTSPWITSRAAGVTAFLALTLDVIFGLFVSTVVRSQVQAMQLSFVFVLPTVLLSGFMFPREAMPALAQWLGAAFPITYYLRVLRGILLKGVGWDALWQDTLVLAVFAIVLLAFSVRRFHKNIE